MSQSWKSALARTAAQAKGCFGRHWRGELPLAESYWAGVVGLNLAIVVSSQALLFLLAACEIASLYVWSYSLTWLMTALGGAWLAVGVWRSAERRLELSPSFWARAAQASVSLNCVGVVVAFVALGYPALKESLEFSKVLAGLAYEVRVLRDGTELELVGAVGPGLAKKVARALDDNPGIRVVHVNLYRGGEGGAARSLRKLIGERKLTTYVSRACVSACTEVFLGGERRYLRLGAKLGFHGPTAPGLSPFGREYLFRRELANLTSVGVEQAFAAKSLRVEPKDMWYPSPPELLAAGVIHGTTAGTEYAPPGPPAAAERGAMEAELLKSPLYRALKDKEPLTYAVVLSALVGGLASGELDRAYESTGRIVRDVYEARLPFADDAALQRVAALYAEQFRLLRKRSPEACWKAGAGGGAKLQFGFSSRLPESFRLMESEVMAGVFETADMSRKPAGGPNAEALLTRIRSDARFRVRINDANPAGPDDPSTDKARECEFKILFFEELATVPASEAALVLRRLYLGTPVPAYR